MIIDALSDLHGYVPALKGGDVLIIAGDITASDDIKEWTEFFKWFKNQNYTKKILVAGNHDNFLNNGFPKTQKQADELSEVESFLMEMGEMYNPDFEYLCDSGTEFEGLNIWGSPWSHWFHGVHPSCKAFMDKESKLASKFSKIPTNTDILITHSPPYLILDDNRYDQPCGSISLRYEMDTRLFPKLHFFGHIHEQYGKYLEFKRLNHDLVRVTKCFNVSSVDENYRPVLKVRRVNLSKNF